MYRYLWLSVTLLVSVTTASAQRRVDPYHIYYRVIAVLPLIGSGTLDDPVRPKYAPSAQSALSTGQPGIIAFAYELSDDGKHAIAELVAIDRSVLLPVLDDHSPGVLAFERGVASKQQIESAMQQYRRDFSLNRFGVPIQ